MKQNRKQYSKQWFSVGFYSWGWFVSTYHILLYVIYYTLCWACNYLCSCHNCVRGYCVMGLGPLCRKVWVLGLSVLFGHSSWILFIQLLSYKVQVPRFLCNLIPLQKNDLSKVCFNINKFWPCLMLECHSRFIQASVIILVWKTNQNQLTGFSCGSYFGRFPSAGIPKWPSLL